MGKISYVEFGGQELSNRRPFTIAFDLSRATNEYIHSFAIQNKICDVPFVNALTQFLELGDTLIDIGSHIGYFSLLARQFVGDTGTIFLFEADPDTFGVMQSSIQMNAYRNMIGFNCAVSDQEKMVEFSICGTDEGQSTLRDMGGRKISVLSTTLDALHQRLKFNKIRVVKIDVEGFEAEVIKGGQTFFKDTLPENVIFEVNNQIDGMKRGQDQLLRAYFADLGYKSYFIRPAYCNDGTVAKLFGEHLLLEVPTDRYIGGLEFGNILASRRKFDAPFLTAESVAAY